MKKSWAILIPLIIAIVFIPALARAASADFNGSVGIGSAAPIVSLDMSQEQDAIALPVGTSGTRPTGGALTNGEIRYNSTTSEVETYTGGSWIALGGASLSGDAFWNNVAFMPRAVVGNTGTDVSNNALPLTLSNITTSSATTEQDAYSWAFNGTNSKISIPSTANVAFSGDFTIELWYYQTNSSTNNQGLFTNPSYGVNVFMGTGASSATPTFGQWGVGTIIVSAGGNTSLNAWHHLAIVRQGGTCYMFVDGTLQGTAANTVSFPQGTGVIGYAGAAYFSGYIAGFRITKFARYTSAFTPPTTPFQTTLLGGP